MLTSDPTAYMVGEAFVLADGKYTTYATVVDATTAAAAGSTVMLAKDATAGDVTVKPGVTLDLNGKILTATSVSSAFTGAHIIGAGKIVSDSVAMAADNKQLSVTIGNETVMETVEFATQYKEENNKATYKFYVKSEAAQTLIDDAIAAGEAVKLEVKVQWTNADGEAKEKTFTLDTALTAQLAADWDNKVVVLNITDLTGVSNLTCTAQVVCGTVTVTA